MSADATGLFLIFMVATITLIVIRRPSWPIVVASAGSWMALVLYLVTNPPAGIAAGSAVHEMLILILSGMAIAILVGGVRGIRTSDSEFKEEPINGNGHHIHAEVTRRVRESRESHDNGGEESTEEYRARIHYKLHPEERKRH